MIEIPSRTYIIAEAGINHNGSLKLAKELVDVAAESGADAVKFQTFKADQMVSVSAQKADYQLKTTAADESQYSMIKRLELDQSSHQQLIEHCIKRGIQFLSSPFDLESIDLLVYQLELPLLKIPSGEITNGEFLLKASQTGKRILLSTGMSTLSEIEMALQVLAFGYLNNEKRPSFENFEEAYFMNEGQQKLRESVKLLHCTTEYPTPLGEVNLRVMDTLHQAFQLPVGLSDHTPGIAVPIAAVARGAVVIEKHFTLGRAMAGPDHKASLEPGELKQMVRSIREVELAIGSSQKIPTESELKNRSIARKSLVAAKRIHKGERFTEYNLTAKRPGGGISPINLWKWIGKTAKKDYEKDEMLKE